MITFDIQIRGNGTQEEIIIALREIADNIELHKERDLEEEGIDQKYGLLNAQVWCTNPFQKSGGYEPGEDEIENDFFNREAGYES